ncbi:odorant receptor 4-like [Spodoptera litura]|uniref:Odorant receptor n=1 Tax=Spodoptera litura TaxID=69820 RepID=A0A9J7EJG7_SPOLT|nr:odorant receptor 4-like [Spodoptera litura]
MMHFEECFKRINVFLKLIGLSIDNDDHNKTMVQRLRKHWMCFIHFFSFNILVLGEIIWLIQGLIYGVTLWEITYLTPCLTLCFLGNFKVYFFLRHMHHVSELVKALRQLHSSIKETDEGMADEAKKWLLFLTSISNLILLLFILGATAFALGPFVISGSHYYTTGEIKLFVPFLIWYPFDPFDIRIWPFVYLNQLWAAWVAIFSVYGPDCFFFTCCTFIQIQFLKLQHDMETMVKEGSRDREESTKNTFKADLVDIVNKHRELMRCVDLLETIFSKSTLLNVMTSSLIICAAGFNLMAIKNLALMAPFTSFLTFGFSQIFFHCYYGDYIMRSSMGVGDAVYNSRWYETGAAERKYLLIVLLRSQKPCRLTAYGFTDINLRAYTRILSTSWSYFALLKQMYN